MPKPVTIIIIIIKIIKTVTKFIIMDVVMTNRRFPIGGWAYGTPYQTDTVLGKSGRVISIMLYDIVAALIECGCIAAAAN